MGEDDPRSCNYWDKSESPNDESPLVADSSPLPWSSRSLGLADLSYLASQSSVRVIGVVGPKNCGKTTLLASIYLLLQRGRLPAGFEFSRSYTIGGWENDAHYLRWNGIKTPSFPPHTTAREGRAPGLLHLGMRTPTKGIVDLAITDAPGEWFRRWAVDQSAADSVGARWVAENANQFVLMIDCDALSGPTRGEALNSYQLIAERLASEAEKRPIQVVWSKSDVQVPYATKARLSERLERLFPASAQSDLSVKPVGEKHEVLEGNFVQLLGWMLHGGEVPEGEVEFPRRSEDSFLAFRTL
jgi:hypothetical protein